MGEERIVHALPAEPCCLLQNGVLYSLGSAALLRRRPEKGAPGVGVIAAAEILVDEPFPVKPGVERAGRAHKEFAHRIAEQLVTQISLPLRGEMALKPSWKMGVETSMRSSHQGLCGVVGFRCAVVPGDGGTAAGGEDLLSKGGHPLRVHVARHAQDHVGRIVEGLMADVEGIGSDMGDGLPAPGHGGADGVVLIEGRKGDW